MAFTFYPARQIAARVESAEGTQVAAASMAVDDLIQTLDPQIQCEPNRFERQLARRGHGTVPQHYAKGTATLTFGVEMAGHTDNAASIVSAPKWSKLLVACGSAVKEASFLGFDGNLTNGPIQHGETITAVATATALGYSYQGDTAVLVEKAGAALTAGAATAGTSGATFTVAALLGEVRLGYAWHPQSQPASNDTLTFHFNIGGQRFQMYGARGSVSFAFATHDRVIANFTFVGIFDEVDASASLSETGADAFEAMLPPAFVNAQSRLVPRGLTGTYGTAITGADLCWDTATFDLGNTTLVRKCANGVDGYIAGVITSRAPTFAFNPDDAGVAAYPYIQKLMEGSQARGVINWGTGTGTRFTLKLPHLQMQTDSLGDRDSRLSHSITFDATLGSFDGASDVSVGFDNEWLLLNY